MAGALGCMQRGALERWAGVGSAGAQQPAWAVGTDSWRWAPGHHQQGQAPFSLQAQVLGNLPCFPAWEGRELIPTIPQSLAT